MANLTPGALRNLEVRLAMAVDALAQAEEDLNRARAKADLPPVEKTFYLREQHERALAAAAAVAAATPAKPEKSPYRWGPFPSRSEPATSHDGGGNGNVALHLLAAVLDDARVKPEQYAGIIATLVDAYGPETPPDAAQAARIGRLVESMSADPSAWSLAPSRLAPTPTPSAPIIATAAAILRAAAIARGEITPLPIDPLARQILAAGRLRRGEPEDKPS